MSVAKCMYALDFKIPILQLNRDPTLPSAGLHFFLLLGTGHLCTLCIYAMVLAIPGKILQKACRSPPSLLRYLHANIFHSDLFHELKDNIRVSIFIINCSKKNAHCQALNYSMALTKIPFKSGQRNRYNRYNTKIFRLKL